MYNGVVANMNIILLELTIRNEDENRKKRSTVRRQTKLDLLQATPLSIPPEVSGNVTEIESSLVEVAIVQMILGLKTFLDRCNIILV